MQCYITTDAHWIVPTITQSSKESKIREAQVFAEGGTDR